MTITRESLIEELRRALPQFKLDETYTEDRLMYPIMNDLARYAIEQSEWGDETELRASLGFVERCVSEGDSYVRDVAHECIESLMASRSGDRIKTAAGMNTVAIWDQIQRH